MTHRVRKELSLDLQGSFCATLGVIKAANNNEEDGFSKLFEAIPCKNVPTSFPLRNYPNQTKTNLNAITDR